MEEAWTRVFPNGLVDNGKRISDTLKQVLGEASFAKAHEVRRPRIAYGRFALHSGHDDALPKTSRLNGRSGRVGGVGMHVSGFAITMLQIYAENTAVVMLQSCV